MARDFFELAGPAQRRLNRSEASILDYVVRNLGEVRNLPIRELAARCFVSTTTIFRFVQHLGFAGYSDFIACLHETEASRPGAQIPSRILERGYGEEYLKNLIETIRVLSPDAVARFVEIMQPRPRVFIVADGFSRQAGAYVHYLLTTLGFVTQRPAEEYELRALPDAIGEGDVLLVLSYSGENANVLTILDRVLAEAKPTVVTITSSATNATFALGDLDLYVFSDAASYRGTDITSRVSMIALVEHLLTALLAAETAQIPEGGQVADGELADGEAGVAAPDGAQRAPEIAPSG